jgi:hypothetical protein
MDGGSLNVRNDELFDKLDSAPKKDVNKLIQLQKETSSNSIKKQIKDSVTAIEETLFTLDIVNTELNDQASKSTEKTDDDYNKTTFELLVNNLNNSNSDNFIKKIEKLYNILYKCYESEVAIKKLQRSSIDEYVKNRILGRVMYNIHYLKNYTRYYEQERFAAIIKKLKKLPKIHEGLHSVEKDLKDILQKITGDISKKNCIDIYNVIEPEAASSTEVEAPAPAAATKEAGSGSAAAGEAESGSAAVTEVEAAGVGYAGGTGNAEQNEDKELYNNATEIVKKIEEKEITQEIKNYVILTIFIKLKTAKKEYKADNTDNEYAKRAGKNTLEILQNSKGDIKDQVVKILLIDYYMVRNFEDTVDYFALETYYRIIFGTELSYDLKLFEHNKYILTRLENIDNIYETIQTIAYDDTFRTLERLYFNKKIGYQNIFRIDTDTSLDIKVFEPQDVFKKPYDTYDTSDSEPEQILRELVLLDINNGIVDRKKLQLFLMFMYDYDNYDNYKNLYELLSKIFNLLIAEIQSQDKESIKLKINELKNSITALSAPPPPASPPPPPAPPAPPAPASSVAPDATVPVPVSTLAAAPPPPAPDAAPPSDINHLYIDLSIKDKFIKVLADIETKLSSKEVIKNRNTIVIEIKKFVREHLSTINKSKQSESADEKKKRMEKEKENKSGLLNEIKQILNLKSDDNSKNNEIKDIFDNYVSNNKIIGGNGDIDIKKEELEKNLNNTSLNDDLTESVTDNAKRKYKKLQRNIEKFFNAKENIEQDDNKLLDQEYLDILRDFNIDDIKTSSYKDLRSKLYKIKNNEYFEDIKITNEDIYTFIATTYVLRVISLYITMWFIQIEIVKDVHSVIVSYILTYILLFILIYTFVNLSDNQLDTSKSFLYYFYTRVNFSYTRFIVHLGLLLLLIIIPFVIRTIDKESSSYKHISDIEKRYLYTFITNMSTIVWVILSIIAFFFK